MKFKIPEDKIHFSLSETGEFIVNTPQKTLIYSTQGVRKIKQSNEIGELGFVDFAEKLLEKINKSKISKVSTNRLKNLAGVKSLLKINYDWGVKLSIRNGLFKITLWEDNLHIFFWNLGRGMEIYQTKPNVNYSNNAIIILAEEGNYFLPDFWFADVLRKAGNDLREKEIRERFILITTDIRQDLDEFSEKLTDVLINSKMNISTHNYADDTVATFYAFTFGRFRFTLSTARKGLKRGWYKISIRYPKSIYAFEPMVILPGFIIVDNRSFIPLKEEETEKINQFVETLTKTIVGCSL